MTECSSGKRRYKSYGEALDALVAADQREGREGHGRGRKRRGVVHPKGAA
jgi:hypothetical protein